MNLSKYGIRPGASKQARKAMASDQDIGKKELETSDLIPFLRAHERVTGQQLSLALFPAENPDFVCLKADGSPVGAELTRITREKNEAFVERILYDKQQMSPFDALDRIASSIDRKELARARRYSMHVPQCILVLQLVDASLEQPAPAGSETVWLSGRPARSLLPFARLLG